MKAVEARGKGSVLAMKAVEARGKGSVLRARGKPGRRASCPARCCYSAGAPSPVLLKHLLT